MIKGARASPMISGPTIQAIYVGNTHDLRCKHPRHPLSMTNKEEWNCALSSNMVLLFSRRFLGGCPFPYSVQQFHFH
jgi:hypothetical protein